ncbi:MAG: hypothetical protein IT324_13295 [Anaerolineae bacterium]|nr:hypothetical protein [Anaerolineae bacterium]
MFRPSSLLKRIIQLPIGRKPAGGVTPVTVRLKAQIRGTWGNAIAVSASSAALTLSGSTLSGGIDWPPGQTNFDTGVNTFDIAGDRWSNEKTNALRIIQEVTDSERGRFYVTGAGVLTWENRDRMFTVLLDTPALNVNSDYANVQGGMQLDQIANRVIVQFTPRTQLTTGVVAKSNTVIKVEPYGANASSAAQRVNISDYFSDPYATVVRLPFIDPVSGVAMGAKSLELPLVPITDYYVTDTEDGTGFNYTDSTLRVAIAIAGQNAEIQFINTAIGNLYVNRLQIRGVGIVSYNPTTVTLDDTASQTIVGVRSMTIDIPLPIKINLVKSLAKYLLERYKNAAYRLQSIRFGDLPDGQGALDANVFSVGVGHVITLHDDQLGFADVKYRIVGINGSLSAHKINGMTFVLSRLDDKTYWLLGNSTYGKLGSTTRLAV